MSQFKELEEIIGKSEKVDIGGKSFEVFELGIASILKIFKRLGNLNIADGESMIKSLANNFDVAVEIVAYATKSPEQDVKQAIDHNKISLDDFTTLTTKAVEVNTDIFLSAIKKIQETGESLGSQVNSLQNKKPSKA